MQIYVPYAQTSDCITTLALPELRETVESAVDVFDVFHETEGVDIRYTSRHPVVESWLGHSVWMGSYALELVENGVGNRSAKWRIKAEAKLLQHMDWASSGSFSMDPPHWWGVARIHRSHRTALMLRDPNTYCPKFNRMPFHGLWSVLGPEDGK